MAVYHLHGQTVSFTVRANGKKNSGLVNFTPESRFNFYKSVTFTKKRLPKPEPGVKDGFEEIEPEFPLKNYARETRITLSNGQFLPKIFN